MLEEKDGAGGDEEEDEDGEMFDVAEDVDAADTDARVSADSAMDASSDSEHSDAEEEAPAQKSRPTAAKDEEQDEEIDLAQLTEMLTDNGSEQALMEAQALKMRNSMKEKKKKDAEEMLRLKHHFKLRVLGLVEVFIAKQHTDYRLMSLAVPLLNALTGNRSGPIGTADKDSLEARISSVLAAKLCKTTPELQLGQIDGVVELMQGLCARAQRSKGDLLQRITQVCITGPPCILYLTRCCLRVGWVVVCCRCSSGVCG